MNEALPPYPDYKTAGLPWLAHVPAHWEIKRAKEVFRVIDQRSQTGAEEKLTVSSKHGVVPRREQKVTMFMAASYVGHKLCWPGDLVINSLWAWASGLGFAKHHGIISTAYSVYRPLPEYSGAGPYLDYLLRSSGFQWEFQIGSKGIWISRLQLTDDTFLRMPIVLPPLLEQQRIVAFLDVKGQQIARLLRNKRQLIKLLTEQKQALIHRAVTQGLDANTPRKDSGVAWLGEVPAHWMVAALRHRYSAQLGKMLDEKKITGDYLIPYLRNTDVQWGSINSIDLPTMDITPGEFNRYTVRAGDLLVCEGGDVGRSAFWTGQSFVCGFQKALHRVRAINTERDLPEFLFFVMFAASKAGVFTADGNENTIPHLTNEKLRAHRFPFPSKKEQEKIVSYLNRKTQEINETISSAQREIELIQEYRARLIADVVTGQVDVRHLLVEAKMELNDMNDDEEVEEEELLLTETEDGRDAGN